MPRVNLIDRAIPSLIRRAKEEGKRIEFADSGTQGLEFGLRVNPSGTATFYARWAWRGKRQRKTLGRYGRGGITLRDARQLASEILGKLAANQDPLLESRRRSKVPTFDELADAYIEHIRSRPKPLRTWRTVAATIERDLRPAFKGKLANEITRADIRRLLREIAEGRQAPISANKAQAFLSAMFTFGLDHEDLLAECMDYNPCSRLKKLGVSRPATRNLSWDEIKALWQAWEDDGSAAALAHQIGLLTGQRRGETLRGRWDEVEKLEYGAWWEIPGSRTKNGRPHRVFLVPMALERLERTEDLGPWLFPTWRRHGEHLRDVRSASERSSERTGITDWSFKTLRATLATRMMEIGVDRFTISRVLNHTEASVTREHYISDEVMKFEYADQKRAAMMRYADRIAVEVGIETSANKILPFEQG